MNRCNIVGKQHRHDHHACGHVSRRRQPIWRNGSGRQCLGMVPMDSADADNRYRVRRGGAYRFTHELHARCAAYDQAHIPASAGRILDSELCWLGQNHRRSLMVRKTLGYVELEWTCPQCGSRDPGPQKVCANCSAAQPAQVEFHGRLNKTDRGTKEIDRAKAGPDVHCAFCGARNPAEHREMRAMRR